jgi:hypothetical protein
MRDFLLIRQTGGGSLPFRSGTLLKSRALPDPEEEAQDVSHQRDLNERGEGEQAEGLGARVHEGDKKFKRR